MSISRLLRIAAAILVVSGSACGTTAPSCTDQYGRGDTQLNFLTAQCRTIGSQLQCQSVASINGLYVYCPMSRDVTLSTGWTVGDSGIVRLVASGVFEAAGIGNTFVRADWQKIESDMRPVSVFTSTPPLPTFEIFGSVYQAGKTVSTGAINGAVVQILDGLVAGRTSTSGVPPPLLPGYLGPFGGPGYYRLLGVPPGTYRMRITKDGYASQERDVTVVELGSLGVDFQLVLH